jgi:hypothetical protein
MEPTETESPQLKEEGKCRGDVWFWRDGTVYHSEVAGVNAALQFCAWKLCFEAQTDRAGYRKPLEVPALEAQRQKERSLASSQVSLH